jgi:hypothetical protein
VIASHYKKKISRMAFKKLKSSQLWVFHLLESNGHTMTSVNISYSYNNSVNAIFLISSASSHPSQISSILLPFGNAHYIWGQSENAIDMKKTLGNLNSAVFSVPPHCHLPEMRGTNLAFSICRYQPTS